MRAAVITVSDSCFRGQRVDVSGRVVSDLLQANAFHVVSHLVVPDDQTEIEDALHEVRPLLCALPSALHRYIKSPQLAG